ncbi:MAG: GIY-YIG nuclease family protein [Bariatricus sp.]
MIGIYKITNKINGNEYIGKSVDIERRWGEHKTPKANGNDRLHKEMQSIGTDNFEFEILEECLPEELSLKELQYIKSLNPFYNTVGKRVSDETRAKISVSAKKWWKSLPEEKKDHIIAGNLTGPHKGHAVSLETRKKISQKVSEKQKQKVRCLETGEIFESISAFETNVGACTGTCAAFWKGKIKTVKGYHVEKCRD